MITAIILLGIPMTVSAQPSDMAASHLGLSRLRDSSAGVELASDRFQVDDLTVGPLRGVRKGERSALDVVLIDSEEAFSRPLRGNRNAIVFVSFGVQGSIGTVIDVAGAKVGVTESAAVSGYAQVMVRSGSDEWQSTGLNVPFNDYDGKRLGTLPVLTVRLDPAAGVFDLYSGSRLISEGIVYVPDLGRREITFTAGTGGAMLTGLVQADDNLLYVDENANGIDDDFEVAKNGELLAADAPRSARSQLIKEWHQVERVLPPNPLFVARPRPDDD